jgi:hypothetical protein
MGKTDWTPSIVPDENDRTVYLVADDFCKSGRAWAGLAKIIRRTGRFLRHSRQIDATARCRLGSYARQRRAARNHRVGRLQPAATDKYNEPSNWNWCRFV